VEAFRIRNTNTLLCVTILLCTLAVSCLVVISPVIANRVVVSFSETISFSISDPGETWSTGKTLHIQNQISEGFLDTGISSATGTITRVLNSKMTEGRTIPMWGTFTFLTDEGQWEGRWRGTISTDGSGWETHTYMGHGTGGLEGYLIRLIIEGVPDQPLSVIGAVSMPRGA
jgi:hypothetical protein